MFEIGFWELVVVAVVALIVVGPEKLPGLARTAGLWLGKARRMIANVKAEVDRELQLEELKRSFQQQADLGGLKDLSQQVKSLERDLQAEFHQLGPTPGGQPHLPSANPLASNTTTTTATATVPVQLAKNDPQPANPPPTAPPASAPSDSRP